MGVDIVGGIPHFERTTAQGVESIKILCEIAEKRGLLVDMHCDESDDPMSRQIESLTYETVRLGLHGRVSGSNTMVRVSREVVEIFLHGNHIASVDTATNDLTLFDGGWQSVTTKSRLNALLDEFVPSMGIFQKNWTWFLSDRLDGSVVPFISGMTV